jgi:hypothetical protein
MIQALRTRYSAEGQLTRHIVISGGINQQAKGALMRNAKVGTKSNGVFQSES